MILKTAIDPRKPKVGASTTSWTDICSCNICIPHILVGYAGGRAMQGAIAEATQKAGKYLMDYAAINYSPKREWLYQYKLSIYWVAFVPFVDELI